jgi:hypothetical protein
MIGLTVALFGLSIAFPSLPDRFGSAGGFALAFGSTTLVNCRFVRRNLRTFNRDEFWKLSFLSSLVSWLLSMALLGIAMAGGGIPNAGALSPAVWILILLFTWLLAFLVSALGYTSAMSKAFLKAELAKHARIDVETFR